ncbi:MAG TPA: hypothetical protein VI306_15310 [Pyrinomonadaceae bacterium]
MKRTSLLLTIASFGIFALAGCQNTVSTAQNPANKNNTKDSASGNTLKPGDVTSDKAIKVSDLVNSVAVDKDAWKGKEVTVTGFVSGTSGSDTHLLLTITDEQMSTNKRDVSCALQGVKSADVFSKPIVVKGTINYSSLDGEFKSVNLEPCEQKK